MDIIALHTRLKEGRIEDYKTIHAVIPPKLDTAMRRAGVRSWRIWRDGRDLFHWVEVEDYAQAKRVLADDPADQEWQRRVSELLEEQSSYTTAPYGLNLVWELPVVPAELPPRSDAAAQ